MNLITRFYPGDEAALFAVNVLAQITAAGFLAWLAERFLRKTSAPTRHGVYLAALSWIFLSPLAAYVCRSAGVVLVAIPVSEAQASVEPNRIMDATSPEERPDHDSVPTADSASQAEPPEESPTSVAAISPTAADAVPAPPTPGLSWADMLRPGVTVAFLLWGLGVLYFLLRLIHGLRMLASLRREVEPIHDERLDAVRAQVCQVLGVAKLPLLVASRQVGSPIAVGICRPMVVLPADLVGVLDERQLREVLIHECAHVLRRDHVVGLLQRVVGMLYWPHPLVHLLNRELAQAREEICDNHVLLASTGPDYARTLLALAEGTTNYQCIPATSGLLGPRWRLEDRVAGLLNQGRKRMIRMNRILAVGVAVLFMTTALAIAGTRLIGATASQAPDSNTKEVAPPAGVSLVPEKREKKGEKPMPAAVPKTSEAVEKDGLSITLAPGKAVFGAKEPLAFVVTLKNVSKEAFMLYDIDWAYALEIHSDSGDGPWLPTPTFEVQRAAAAPNHSKVLKPGASLEIKLPLDKYVYAYGGPQNMTPRPLPFLEPGKYSIRATRHFAMNPVKFDWPHRHWLGKITTKPVEFTVAGEKPAGRAAIDKTVPDTADGLSMTIAPAKRTFETQEPLAFVVTLKNVSKEPFILFDAEWAMSYGLEITRVADGELWIANSTREVVRAPAAASDSKVLQAGDSLEIKLPLSQYAYISGDPKKPTSRTRPFLYPGIYNIRVTRSFAMNPVKFDWPHKHWVGSLATEPFAMNKLLKKPVEFMIGPSDKPAAASDLSMTLTPVKSVFAAKEPLAFIVKLQNVSKEPFMLYQTDRASDYVLEIKSAAGGAPITLSASKAALKRGEGSGSQFMEPGATLQIKLPLDGYQYSYRRAQDAAPAAHEHLEPGKYTIHVTRKFVPEKSLIDWLNRHWLGTSATKPVEFTVAAQKPAGGAAIDKAVPKTANGLSITVKPTKAIYPENDLKDLLTFTVSFKNVSNKTLLLYDIDETMRYQVAFNGVPAGGPWVPGYNLNHQAVREAPKASDSKALAPGATLEKQVVMNGVSYFYRGPQPAKNPVTVQHLDAGKYRVTVGFKGVMNPANVEWKDEHWIGEVAAQSPEFAIAAKKQASAAIVDKGLSVAATTEHRVFPGNVIPHFKVRFENVSGKDLGLFGYQTPNWTLHIKNKATGLVQTWKHAPRAGAPEMAPLILATGKAHEEEVVLNPATYYVPPKNAEAVAIEPGKYEIVFAIELRESPKGRGIAPAYWVGQVRTTPLEFTVGDGATKEH